MTTSADLAVRNSPAPAPAAALAIQPGQVTWDKFQDAALAQIGLKDASNADKAVFLHQCQRTGLDPFSRQIYMIARYDTQTRGNKWTIQTGIDGYRVMRARAERQAGARCTLGRAIFYDLEGTEHKVWVQQRPPAACEITLTVYDAAGATDYTSVLRFDEYVQTKTENGQRVPIAQWAVKPAHMLEKCTEADVYRKAFPQDFSGVYLDDAMPAPDPSEVRRPAPDADALRQRAAAQTVTATVVTPDAASGDNTPTPAPEAAQAERPPALISSGQKAQIDDARKRLGYSDSEEDLQSWLSAIARLAGLAAIARVEELTQADAAAVIGQLKPLGDAQDLMDLLQTGELPGE